jgi:hypothetical protein
MQAVGAVCLIDTQQLNQKGQALHQQQLQLLKRQSASSSAAAPAAYASGTPSPESKKILDENIAPASVTGTGKTEESLKMML